MKYLYKANDKNYTWWNIKTKQMIFEMYIRWNMYTNQMTVKNYTSWNIKTKPITLETYAKRCRKLHLKMSTLPTCSDGWNWGVAHCMKVLGAVLLLPVKWPRLSGAIGAGLQRRHIACGSQCHMKPIADEISIHKSSSSWNLYQIKYYFKPVQYMKYTSKLY